MELKEFIQTTLERAKQATLRVVNGLSQDEIAWQPNLEANSIGFLLFHLARFEDTFVQTRVQGKTQLWESQKWYERLHMPASETGSGYTAEQLANFKTPVLKDLLEYADAVRSQTVEYLKGAAPAEFDRVINLGRSGEVGIGAVFTLILTHISQHTGEISYIRGLKRGMNK